MFLPLLVAAAVVAVFSMTPAAVARNHYPGALETQYPNVQLTGKCQTCHRSHGLNQFGQDFYSVILQNQWSQEALLKFAQLDSDQDQVNNLTEMQNGTNPGVAESEQPQ